MKTFLMAASALTLIATPAFAQTTQTVDVTASVPGVCTIGDPATIALSSLNVNTTNGANALTLVATGSYVATATENFWVSCNDTNRMTITSLNQGNLVRTGAAPTVAEADQGFTNKIAYHIGATNYRPGVDWQYQPTLNEGNNNNYMNHTRGAIHQEVGMQVRIGTNLKNAGKRPLAGAYTDTVTITVQIAA